MSKPLSHFRIVDLSCILAGPFCTQLLADFGAEVQKLEPPEGDPTRGWGPPFEDGDAGESAYFRCANRGKRSRRVDLHTEAGKADLFDLLKEADVLVENLQIDSADRLGLGWKRLHAKFPRLILASIRGFASDVTASRRTGYDFIIQAESGWMAITGEPGGRPMKIGVALVDVLAGLYCANGIQAAMLHRERTGEALHIEVPLMEVALAALANVASDSLMTGEAPKRWGNAHPHIVFPLQRWGRGHWRRQRPSVRSAGPMAGTGPRGPAGMEEEPRPGEGSRGAGRPHRGQDRGRYRGGSARRL
jgi:crotonobetainyl-CoA:carnitine CoA-transferase CaiB-like acyl-CoA transferase